MRMIFLDELPVLSWAKIRRVPGWPTYAVTDGGEVWSFSKKHGWKERKLIERKLSGHLWVRLENNGRSLSTYAHRLVLLAFVGPCQRGYESRHLDNDPKNNTLSNLEWNTRKVNQGDRRRFGTQTQQDVRNGRFVVHTD